MTDCVIGYLLSFATHDDKVERLKSILAAGIHHIHQLVYRQLTIGSNDNDGSQVTVANVLALGESNIDSFLRDSTFNIRLNFSANDQFACFADVYDKDFLFGLFEFRQCGSQNWQIEIEVDRGGF